MSLLSKSQRRTLEEAKRVSERHYADASRVADLATGSTARLARDLAVEAQRIAFDADRALAADARARAENDRRIEEDRMQRRTPAHWREADGTEVTVVPPGPRRNVEVEARRPDPVDPQLTEYHIKRGGRDMSEFGGEPLSWMERYMYPARKAALTNCVDAAPTRSFCQRDNPVA